MVVIYYQSTYSNERKEPSRKLERVVLTNIEIYLKLDNKNVFD